MKRVKKQGLIVIVFLLIVMAACSKGGGGDSRGSSGGSSSGGVTNLTIGGGGTSGTYYYIGAGIANMFQKHEPDIKVNVEVTAAGLENSRLLFNGDLDLAQIDGATLTLFAEENPLRSGGNWRWPSQFTHIIVRKIRYSKIY